MGFVFVLDLVLDFDFDWLFVPSSPLAFVAFLWTDPVFFVADFASFPPAVRFVPVTASFVPALVVRFAPATVCFRVTVVCFDATVFRVATLVVRWTVYTFRDRTTRRWVVCRNTVRW